MRVAIFDIESTQIPTLVDNIEKIFCIAIKVNDEPTKCYTYLYTPYSDGNLQRALDILNSCDLVVGHNICKFDIPVIEKIIGKITTKICDTFIDSQLCYPKNILYNFDMGIKELPKSLIGSYSLKAFGYRFGLNKIEYEDFSHLCEDMVTYCKRDVDLTYELYHHLISLDRYPSSNVREVEYRFASIIYKQENYGFYFDIDKAMNVAAKLQWKALDAEMKLRKVFPPKFVADGDVVYPKKTMKRKNYQEVELDKFRNLRPFEIPLKIMKNGRYKYLPKSTKWLDYPFELIYSTTEENCPYQKIKLQKFNPNSRQQIVERLQDTFNLKIESYTPKGNVKLSEEILDFMVEELEKGIESGDNTR